MPDGDRKQKDRGRDCGYGECPWQPRWLMTWDALTSLVDEELVYSRLQSRCYPGTEKATPVIDG